MSTPARKLYFYVGTRASDAPNQIHHLSIDCETLAITQAGSCVRAENPSFLALHPSGRTLYAVNELGRSGSESVGTVSAFAVDPSTGDLTFLGCEPTRGAAPCHVRVGDDGRHLFVANYWGGSAAVYSIQANGCIGTMSAFIQHEGGARGPDRDPGPHAHWISPDRAGRHVLVVDLGRDAVVSYSFDAAAGALDAEPAAVCQMPVGSGPRHAVFAGDGRHIVVASELASTIALFDYDVATGRLAGGSTVSTLPDGFAGENAIAEVAISPDNQFVYASNRGHDSVAAFRLDAAAGVLTPVACHPSGGNWPRHFRIDPAGRFLIVANQRSNTLTTLRIDSRTGELAAGGPPYDVPAPVCVIMAPDDLPAGRPDRS